MTDYYPEAPKVPNREQIAKQLSVDVEDIPAPRCAVNIGDYEVCRCILARGHDGLHACRHEAKVSWEER